MRYQLRYIRTSSVRMGGQNLVVLSLTPSPWCV